MRGLAFRRNQLMRAKARARRYLRLIDYGAEWVTARVVGRHATDRVLCSCWMCGNARRHQGEMTRQELRVTPESDGFEPRSGGSP